ncbi:MAG: hypothetical protein C4316_08010 [Chloroflexota bacterium]
MFALTRVLDQPKGFLKSRLINVVGRDSFRAISSHVVEVKTLTPFPFLPYLMTHPYMIVVEPEAYQKNEIVGTGPFKFKRHEQDQYVIVERNESYWGEKAKVKEILFKTVPDPNTRLLALQRGDVDLAFDPPLPALAEIKHDGRFDVAMASASTIITRFNHINEPLNDSRLRKALSMAVNKEQIANNLTVGGVAKTLILPEFLYSVEKTVNGLPYNPSQARRLLEEAG